MIDKNDIIGWATINGRRVPIRKSKQPKYDKSKDKGGWGYYSEDGKLVVSPEKKKQWRETPDERKPHHFEPSPLGEENRKKRRKKVSETR